MRISSGLVMLCFASPSFSQNLESIGKEKPLSISGGISANQILYSASGIESRREPYSYFLSGNLNMSFYGWNVPLSFSYSNQNISFRQPFNQYSFHPTYKWITAHFGYTSMSFSSYTVNGHLFLGGGVDVEPEGNWKLSALYGRFLKPVVYDSLDANSLPSYKRMGYGFKASYSNNGNTADLILFHAADEENSITSPPDSLNVLPLENLVLSLAAGKTFLQHLVVRAEFATSALSGDIRSAETNSTHLLGKMSFLYKPRLSSSFYNAFRTSLDFQQDSYTIGVAYEQIDPRYRTLGAYYFNNDLRNITVNGATTMLQNKMNIAVSAGTQQDNLDNSKISTMRRMVGSVNVNFMPSEKLNFSSSLSTFQSYTNIRSQFVDINQLTPYDNLDTLNFTQLSSNATLSAMYSFGKNEQRKQSFNFNVNYQKTTDRQDNEEQNTGMRFYNFNSVYALNLIPYNMLMSLSFNAALNEGAISSRTIGPTAAISKSFLEKKLRTTLSSSFNNTYMSGARVNSITNFRLNGNLSLQKKHNVTISISVVNRDSKSGEVSKSFSEYTGALGYNYFFGVK